MQQWQGAPSCTEHQLTCILMQAAAALDNADGSSVSALTDKVSEVRGRTITTIIGPQGMQMFEICVWEPPMFMIALGAVPAQYGAHMQQSNEQSMGTPTLLPPKT